MRQFMNVRFFLIVMASSFLVLGCGTNDDDDDDSNSNNEQQNQANQSDEEPNGKNVGPDSKQARKSNRRGASQSVCTDRGLSIENDQTRLEQEQNKIAGAWVTKGNAYKMQEKMIGKPGYIFDFNKDVYGQAFLKLMRGPDGQYFDEAAQPEFSKVVIGESVKEGSLAGFRMIGMEKKAEGSDTCFVGAYRIAKEGDQMVMEVYTPVSLADVSEKSNATLRKYVEKNSKSMELVSAETL